MLEKIKSKFSFFDKKEIVIDRRLIIKDKINQIKLSRYNPIERIILDLFKDVDISNIEEELELNSIFTHYKSDINHISLEVLFKIKKYNDGRYILYIQQHLWFKIQSQYKEKDIVVFRYIKNITNNHYGLHIGDIEPCIMDEEDDSVYFEL